MKRIKTIAQFSFLILGALVSIATSQPPPSGFYFSDAWVVENLYDGQTAVETDIEIGLTLGTWDFDPTEGLDRYRATNALKEIRLYPADDENESVPFTLALGDQSSVLIPDRLEENTDYVLDLEPLVDTVESDRMIPAPIRFHTGSLPRVIGLWRNDDTLLIAFSEPMDENDLFLGHESTDIFWQDEYELKSVVGDLNLADFVTQVDDRLFMVAPVDFLNTGWVKVSGLVRGESGVSLDGDGNGEADGVGDDFLEETDLSDLPECFTREDIPAPCTREEDVPDEWVWM